MRQHSKPNARDIAPEKLADLKRNAAAILADTRMAFQRQQPFVGSVSMSLNLIPTRDSRNPTAATDGTNLYFDIAFLSELSPNDRMFIIGHEVYHNVMLHFIRQEGRDRELWNIAADMEVNGILAEDGMIPPNDALLPEKYGFPRDKSAEEYYERLIARQKWQQANSSQNSPKGDGSAEGQSSGQSSDESDGSSSQPTPSGNADGKLDGQFDKHIYDDEDAANEAAPEDVSDKYGKVGKDEDYQPNVKPNTVEKIRESAVAAAQQIERQRGELPAHLQRLVQKLLEPEVNWKELLAQYVTRSMTNDPTWNRPNKRFAARGTYLPGHEGKRLKIAIGLDTSGSTVVDTEKFISELNGIVQSYGSYEIDVIQCDTEVTRVDHYDEETPFDITNGFEQEGGGGTKLKGIFDYIDSNNLDIDACCIMTDGYCEQFAAEDAPNYPVLWILTKDGNEDNLGFGDKVKFS